MTQWINDRMNKDNFWNLMFWVLISLGFGIASLLNGEEPKLGAILLWSFIFLAIYLVKTQTKVTFDKEEFFLNSRGERLFARCSNFVLTILGSCGAFVYSGDIGRIFFGKMNDTLSAYFAVVMFLLTFVSFFIYKNCPIHRSWNIKIKNLNS